MGPKRTRVERREEEAAGGEMDEVPGDGDEVELRRIAEDLSLQELRDMLRTHLAMQQGRDSRMEQESIRQEARLKALQHQFNLLQQEVHRRTTPAPGQVFSDSIQHDTVTVRQTPSLPMDGQSSIQPTVQARLWSSQGRDQTGVVREPRLQPLNDAEDIEHYLTTFERIAVACRWPTTDWAVRLVPLLTGKARSAYVHMDIKDSLDYAKVKAAILSKYNINPESYRLQFRATEVGEEETPKELYVRLKELFQKWVQPQNRTKEEIAEVIILEQYLRMLAPELQIWIKEHNPCSASEAAMLADIFVAARRKAQPWTYRRWKETKEPTKPRKMLPSSTKATTEGKSGGDRVGPAKQCPSLRPRTLICYQCGQEGHKKPECPNNPSTHANLCSAPRPVPFEQKSKIALHYIPVVLNGQKVEALVDTGSMQSLVSTKLVPIYLRDDDSVVSIRCVHGEERQYPTANVYVSVQGQSYLLRVGLSDELPYSVILGQDLPVLFDLLPPGRNCNLAITRSMAMRGEDNHHLISALPFFEADLDTEPGKPRKTRQQRRSDKFRFAAANGEDNLIPGRPGAPIGLEVPHDIASLQKGDLEIGSLYEQAQERGILAPTSAENQECRYYRLNGVLHRKHGLGAQLVVPKKVRELVLKLGHSIPWAGHLGRQKTLSRISRHFFWPGMNKEVANYCRSCPECQQTASKGPPKVPLEPLPIVGVPFEQLAMDVVGPLEKSKAGNRFLLVMTDYATRYPEVFPLKTVRARTVAWCLIQLFSRVGFPKVILTDQGSNFMSKLLKQVYKLLGIKGIRTTPYHPQTDGLVERFNQTLKQMLRKFVNETGTDWDQWLPYLLFAYREVPQASTGFSPFELLYCREVRGPLSLLKDTWVGGQESVETKNIVAYVLQMREKLENMTKLAHENMEEAQRRQKTWYDHKARARSFNPGDKVLVMLPSEASKLLAKWQGPFEVVQKLGPTTYEVASPGERRSRRVLHINLLKEWHERTKSEVLMIRHVEDEEEVNEQYLPAPSHTNLDISHLSASQQSDIQGLCCSEVLQERPGRTLLVEHDIVLCEGAAARRMSYRIPEHLLTALREEIDQMLAMGIIESSKSEWCSPVVLVPKKDGSLRFCVDFRYLNSVSKFDSYPTPRIDSLIECLGKAKWLTTIDLRKGYWQVPLSARSKELTAFRTPWGLFHFSVMPFGLHGAPATFQRLMDQVLTGLNTFAAAYLDDIIVYSSSWEDHVRHLGQVFERIRSAGLTINPSKCAIAKTETEYLGYVIGNGIIKPQVQKVEVIRSCPLPQTKTQVRSFLGMAGWYRRFVPNFSIRAVALIDLTRKNSPNKIQWTEEAEAAFQDIKNALCADPVLYCPDFAKPFVLQTDASETGIGAVLLQGEPEDRHPVAYISRTLFPREVQYSTVEKECLAVKWALDRFRYYLLGREFLLETDHRPLQWMDRMKDSNARITRWYLSMQPYKFTIRHVPGRNNTTADFLSRLPA